MDAGIIPSARLVMMMRYRRDDYDTRPPGVGEEDDARRTRPLSVSRLHLACTARQSVGVGVS